MTPARLSSFLEKVSLLQILYASLVAHGICSFFSTGYHQFDEHYQIYEFLNFKLGGIQAKELPWEFSQKVRPWIQVYFYQGIHSFFSFFGVSSPFSFAFLFRLMTSLVGVFSLFFFLPTIREWFEKEREQKLCYLLLNFTYFVPYIHSRSNAESLSSSAFFIGLGLFIKSFRRDTLINALAAGFFLGLAYNIRYQLSVMVAGLWFWALIYKTKEWRISLVSALAILVMIGGGVIVDFYGYGEWTFAPYNLYVGNFLEKRLQNSGESPFWYYLNLGLKEGFAPLYLPLIFACFWGVVKFFKHPLTWATLPLVLFHSLIGHKEFRYLFPYALFTPIYLCFFILEYEKYLEKRFVQLFASFFLILNMSYLVGTLFRSANSTISFYKFLYFDKTIEKFYHQGIGPFSLSQTPLKYYRREGVEITRVENVLEFVVKEKNTYLFFKKGSELLEMEKRGNCTRMFMTYPRWTLNFNIGGWVNRSRVWSMYRCDPVVLR